MPRWDYFVELDDDSEWFDIEAPTIEDAARQIYDEWHPTAWHNASVYGPDYALSIDLDGQEFNTERF